MRRLFARCALCTTCLLSAMLDASGAGEPTLGPPVLPPVTEQSSVATPGRPTLSLVAVEPPAMAPKLGAIIPVSNLPVAPRTAPDQIVSSLTLSETIVRTVTNPDTGVIVPQPRPALPPNAALPPSGITAVFPRAEPALKRKSYVDLSASPCFNHAPDYNWIYGRVEYSSVTREWRLRYASVDETDRYGGRVSLIENHQAELLREGMYVHVRGHIVNPENDSNSATFYRIEWFRAINNPNVEQQQPTDTSPIPGPIVASEAPARPKLLDPVFQPDPERR